jgi:hypothetical protein
VVASSDPAVPVYGYSGIRFARRALQDRIASLQEIARYVNRSASSLNELLIRHR